MPRLALGKVLDRVEEIARDVVAPLAPTTDRDAAWPEDAIRALQQAELGGLVVGEDRGGLGHGLLGVVQACEVLGRECASAALCIGMHWVGTAVIAAKATPEQAERYLDPIVAGKHLTTLALSEPGTGSYFWLPAATLTPTDGGYLISGRKTFVTNGGHADSYVVSTVAADPDAPPGEFSCLVVPGDAPGLHWGAEWAGLGMRGNSSRSVELRDVEVPVESLLGGPGEQIWYVFNVVAPYFLAAMAGTYLGLASAALDDARLHVVERRHAHSGTRLSQEPVIQHRMGELWAAVERSRRLVYHAAQQAETGTTEALPALCSAKADVAECATLLANESMTLLGGIGYRDDGPAGRRLRDARAAHVMAPTTETLRAWTGRAILGENILGE